MTPFIGWTIVERNWNLALPMLFYTGMSDAVDGWLARTLKQQTALGAKLDPIADKLLLACVYLALGWCGELPWWLIALVFTRDLMILAMAGYAMRFTAIHEFAPSIWGKISTFCQLMLAGNCTLRRAWPDSWLASLVPLFFYLTVVFTLVSGIHYAVTAVRRFRVAALSAGQSHPEDAK
jgi:cardiolipin synthase